MVTGAVVVLMVVIYGIGLLGPYIAKIPDGDWFGFAKSAQVADTNTARDVVEEVEVQEEGANTEATAVKVTSTQKDATATMKNSYRSATTNEIPQMRIDAVGALVDGSFMPKSEITIAERGAVRVHVKAGEKGMGSRDTWYMVFTSDKGAVYESRTQSGLSPFEESYVTYDAELLPKGTHRVDAALVVNGATVDTDTITLTVVPVQ